MAELMRLVWFSRCFFNLCLNTSIGGELVLQGYLRRE